MQLFPISKPKILLLNFGAWEQEELRKKNFNVELGWASGGEHFFPSPSYEYDIVIARFDEVGQDAARNSTGNQVDISHDRAEYEALTSKIEGSGFALIFSGDDQYILASGIRNLSLSLVELDERDTEYRILDEKKTESREEIEKPGLSFISALLMRFRDHIIRPVKYGISPDSSSYVAPLKIVPIAWNANRQLISCLGLYEHTKTVLTSPYTSNQILISYTLRFIFLPSFKDHIRIINEILAQLSSWRPDLFLQSVNFSWLDEEKYFPKQVLEIHLKLEAENKRHEEAIGKLQAEVNEYIQKDWFMRQLIIADDSDEFEEALRLTPAVEKALQELGFAVERRETVLREGKRREDLIIRDEEFEALLECKGTTSSNPPERFVSQLQQHLLSNRSTPSGILVVNHDRMRDAFSRGLPYEDAKHLWEDATNITVLPSVELYKIVRAVQGQKLSKVQARELIKQPGRVQYQEGQSNEF